MTATTLAGTLSCLNQINRMKTASEAASRVARSEALRGKADSRSEVSDCRSVAGQSPDTNAGPHLQTLVLYPTSPRESHCDVNVSQRCPGSCPAELLSKTPVLLGPRCACPAPRDCTHPRHGDAAASALLPVHGARQWLSIRTSSARRAEQRPRARGIRCAPRVAAAPRIPTRPQLRHGLLAPGNCNPGPPGTRMAKGEGRQDQHPAGGLIRGSRRKGSRGSGVTTEDAGLGDSGLRRAWR